MRSMEVVIWDRPYVFRVLRNLGYYQKGFNFKNMIGHSSGNIRTDMEKNKPVVDHLPHGKQGFFQFSISMSLFWRAMWVWETQARTRKSSQKNDDQPWYFWIPWIPDFRKEPWESQWSISHQIRPQKCLTALPGGCCSSQTWSCLARPYERDGKGWWPWADMFW